MIRFVRRSVTIRPCGSVVPNFDVSDTAILTTVQAYEATPSASLDPV